MWDSHGARSLDNVHWHLPAEHEDEEEEELMNIYAAEPYPVLHLETMWARLQNAVRLAAKDAEVAIAPEFHAMAATSQLEMRPLQLIGQSWHAIQSQCGEAPLDCNPMAVINRQTVDEDSAPHTPYCSSRRHVRLLDRHRRADLSAEQYHFQLRGTRCDP